jgi:hypothetical protein
MITRIYTRDFVEIDYDPSARCLLSKNLKFMLSDEFRSHLEFALEFMKDRVIETGKNIMWLVDTRLSPVFPEEDVQWATQDWTPRALNVGVTHVAFIVSQRDWELMGGVDKYNDEGSKAGMKVAYFADIESAKKWFSESAVVKK